MASRAYQYDEDISGYDGVAAADSCAPAEFYAGERICSSGSIRRRSRVLKTIVVMSVVLGCGTGWVRAPEELKGRIVAGIEAAISGATWPTEMPAAPPQAVATESSAAPPLPETREVALEPAVQAGVPVSAPKSEATAGDAPPDPAAETQAAAPEPLAPPVIDPADRYQKRAMAVGLHPDLSRALLSRLTDADYRNAGIAIHTALVQTPASKVYAWPKDGGGAKLALFEISFVRGATPECRRYVVTVTLAHWSTTALPMEKCGVGAKGKAVKAGVN